MRKIEDVLRLHAQGFSTRRMSLNSFRARLSDGLNKTRLDWAVDSDYRFYPVQKDKRFGYVLHPVDLATNKLLAAEGRNEVRDAIDLMTVDSKIMPLGATAWAAAAKSPGLTPDGIIEALRARARFTDAHLSQELLTRRLGAAELNTWLRARCDAARAWLDTVPQGYDFGLFIDAHGRHGQPDFNQAGSEAWRIHEGRRGGAWPSSSEISGEMIQRAMRPRRDEKGPERQNARHACVRRGNGRFVSWIGG
jgi:hypothetical protein